MEEQGFGSRDPAAGLGGRTGVFQGVCLAATRGWVEKQQAMKTLERPGKA